MWWGSWVTWQLWVWVGQGMAFLDTGGVWEAAKSAVLAMTVTWEDAVLA